MTVVPTVLGGFWSAVTGTLPTVFPFCWWLVVLQDHFSRRIQGFELFKREPASVMIRAFLDRAFEAAGTIPKHVIVDKGRQFDCEAFRAWCRGHGIRWRYGAAGKKGSIAVIERLIRTIKTECARVIRVPSNIQAMRAELDTYAAWHNGHRPHTHLGGRTPDEVCFDRKPANELPRARRSSFSSSGSQSTSLIHRFRHDWSVVTANSELMPETFFLSATISPVRYSAKWRRSGSLTKTEPKTSRASWTTVGNSTMPGMGGPSTAVADPTRCWQ